MLEFSVPISLLKDYFYMAFEVNKKKRNYETYISM